MYLYLNYCEESLNINSTLVCLLIQTGNEVQKKMRCVQFSVAFK